MNLRLFPLSLAVALAVSACGGTGPADSGAAPADATASGAETSAGTDATDAATATEGRIQLTVTGGANAGSYDIGGTDGCSFNIAGKGAWGNQFSRDAGATEVSSLQLIVPDATAAAAGTGTFLLTVGFGPQFGPGGTSYTVDSRNGKGSGTVKVDDRDSSGTVTFDATTADGVQLKGSIECATVVRG